MEPLTSYLYTKEGWRNDLKQTEKDLSYIVESITNEKTITNQRGNISDYNGPSLQILAGGFMIVAGLIIVWQGHYNYFLGLGAIGVGVYIGHRGMKNAGIY